MATVAVLSLGTISLNYFRSGSAVISECRVPPSQHLLADHGSAIELVVCSLTSARKSSLRNSQLIENIINALPQEVHVLVLVNDPSSFSQRSGSHRVTFLEVPTDAKISIWPQDPFLVTVGDRGTRLITPKQFDRGDDDQMAKRLSNQLDLPITETRFLFEGGNIVCGSGAVLIGKDTIVQNMLELKETEQEIVLELESLLGMPVCIVGEGPQAVGHIDLIVTPVSQDHFMVADCRAGAERLASELADNPANVIGFEKQCEDEFFGSSRIDSLVDANGETLTRPRVRGSASRVIAHSLEIADRLDQIAIQIENRGFQVTRIPALVPPSVFTRDSESIAVAEKRSEKVRFGGTSSPALAESKQALVVSEGGNRDGSLVAMEQVVERNYPFLTYNNVLTETRSGQKIVYLPQYGLAILDQQACEVWSRLGFKVVPVYGVTTSAMYGGSLRCCTKVLLRE